MKKQWILIVVLAAFLVAAVIIASRSFPNVNQTPGPNSTGTTQTTGSGSESTDPTDNNADTFPTVSYEEYQFVMSDTERQAYYDKFSSHEAYLAWFYPAKAEFEAKEETDTTPKINGDEPIDIGGLSGNNNG